MLEQQEVSRSIAPFRRKICRGQRRQAAQHTRNAAPQRTQSSPAPASRQRVAARRMPACPRPPLPRGRHAWERLGSTHPAPSQPRPAGAHLGHVCGGDALAHPAQHQGGQDGGEEGAHAVDDGVGALQLGEHRRVGRRRHLVLVCVALCSGGGGHGGAVSDAGQRRRHDLFHAARAPCGQGGVEDRMPWWFLTARQVERAAMHCCGAQIL